MKYYYLFFLFVIALAKAWSQTGSLYDDTRISSVYISLPEDSLEVIMTDVLSDHYFLATFVFDNQENRDTVEQVGFRLRGNTSRYARKKSFKISFNEYVPGRKYQGVKKINLNGQHNDPTMMREKLYYELWKQVGMPERRTSFVRVYINNRYYGLYTNIEEMDKQWLGRVYEDNDGNLYKCTYPADMVYHGPLQQTYKDLQNATYTGGRVYDLQTNEEEDDYTHLVELITQLNRTPDSAFASSIGGILDTDVFLRTLALDVATGNWDNYSYNRNNFYLYDDPDVNRFRFISYDTDNTFGVDWLGVDWGERDCKNWVNPDLDLPLAQKLMAVPSFYQQYLKYLDTIARTILFPDSVFQRIDQLKLLMTEAAEADSFRTLDYGYSIGDFHSSFFAPIDSHTPYGLKPFISLRSARILEQLPHASTGGQPEPGMIIRPGPVPAENRITFYFTGKEPPDGLRLSIFNVHGIEMPHQPLAQTGSSAVSLDIQDFPPGMYIARFYTSHASMISRFIRK